MEMGKGVERVAGALHRTALTCKKLRAGDENRTRVLSLGNRSKLTSTDDGGLSEQVRMPVRSRANLGERQRPRGCRGVGSQ